MKGNVENCWILKKWLSESGWEMLTQLRLDRILAVKLCFRGPYKIFYASNGHAQGIQWCPGKSLIWGFFRVFVDNFSMKCRMVLIFLRVQRASLGGPSRYLEHGRRMCRKFSTVIWKQVSPLKWSESQVLGTRAQPGSDRYFFENPTFSTFPST